MDPRKLQKTIVSALEDMKGQEIEIINTNKLTPLFERMIIASGTSSRHVKSLAQNVQDKARAAGAEILSIEGEDNGEWVLVDLGDIVVHVMLPAVRAYYNLEELWKASPAVRRKAAENSVSGLPEA